MLLTPFRYSMCIFVFSWSERSRLSLQEAPPLLLRGARPNGLGMALFFLSNVPPLCSPGGALVSDPVRKFQLLSAWFDSKQ